MLCRHTAFHLYRRIRQFPAANTLVLKYLLAFAISEARRESQYKFVLHARLFAIKALNSLFFIIYVHTAMKSTPTLCELLIFIICICILLFCFTSVFFSVLLLCFPAVLAHFVRHFQVDRGRFYFFSPTMFYFGEIRVAEFSLEAHLPPKCCHSTDCLFCTKSVFNVSGFQPLEISFKLKK